MSSRWVKALLLLLAVLPKYYPLKVVTGKWQLLPLSGKWYTLPYISLSKSLSRIPRYAPKSKEINVKAERERKRKRERESEKERKREREKERERETFPFVRKLSNLSPGMLLYSLKESQNCHIASMHDKIRVWK